MYQYLKSFRYYQTGKPSLWSEPCSRSRLKNVVYNKLSLSWIFNWLTPFINIAPYRLLRYSDHVTCILQERLIKVRRRYTCTSF